MPTTANAARLLHPGRPLSVTAVELPDPGPDEVVVTLSYGAVNPVDRYVVAGRVAADGPLPRTVGSEAAGTVGDRRVVVRGHGLGATRDGLWASAAVVPQAALVDVPDGVPLDQAAAMGVAGATAWRVVHELAEVRPHDRVLVLGASGGVGSMVVSLAARLGARVVGQTGQRAKADWVRARGAADVAVGGPEAVADAAAALRPTVVFDALGGDFTGAGIEALEPKGRLVLYGTSADPSGPVPLQALYRKGLRLLGYGGLNEPDQAVAAAVRAALAAVADGRLEVVVGATRPLGEVNEALDEQAGRRVLGKLVLELGG